jgi:uncharacterized repeat protein (TIGR03803 family)
MNIVPKQRNGVLRTTLSTSSVLALATVLGLTVIETQSAQAQTFTTLYNFCSQSKCTDGLNPEAGLIQGTDGDLHGTTYGAGGGNGAGTVFTITPGGTLTTQHNFCSKTNCTDGSDPAAGLIQGTNGDFYGTTIIGGATNSGTVFKITPSGKLTTVYSFCSQTDCTDGDEPVAGLIQEINGDFYGTTCCGGANPRMNYAGTVFKITPNGKLTTLYSFCLQTNCTDGNSPAGGLIQATDGILYGTTYYGGANSQGCESGGSGCGTVFSLDASGTLTTLHSFCTLGGSACTDGYFPRAGLLQASNGNLYGTTEGGGANDAGTVFEITPSGTLTTLYSFCSTGGNACTDGSDPAAGLIQATNGNFYGTTQAGGANAGAGGTVFEITPSGTLTTLYSFCSTGGSACTDGETPVGGLIQATNGVFYGTTEYGGANGGGVVFRLSVGLHPFVETQTTSGKVGAAVTILGSDLTGATSVTFNGTAATFTVVSEYEITTTVPADAATGFVEVITPGGKLKSNKKYRVKL